MNPLEESGLAPKEIWCNESQERYVLAIAPASLEMFRGFCERERCPFAVVGVATEERQLVVEGAPLTPAPSPPGGGGKAKTPPSNEGAAAPPLPPAGGGGGGGDGAPS